MRTVSIAIVLISLTATIPAQSQGHDSSDIDAVRQVEQSMGKAMVAGDVDKLNQIYADDFATFGSSGKGTTKQSLISDFESFHDKLEWFENGPIDVQVFGDLALAQGFVREKRSQNGKDTSGQFLWQDLLKKRAGQWVVWRSAGARVVSADSSEPQFRDPVLVDTLKQFEENLGNAMVALDMNKINRAYAEDWATIGSDGEIFTKDGLLEDFKSGKHRLVSFENGPMNVLVLGDVAVVQTSVREKRIQNGKDISGEFAFMDLLKRREGKWVIVRTLAARVS